MIRCLACGLVLTLTASPASRADDATPTTAAASPPPIVVEKFAYKGTFDGVEPLYALIAYPREGHKLPLIVCMHGYSETAGRYIRTFKPLAGEGWFVACVEMRGRGGSAGRHDSGGLEIHDIYDAVEALKRRFPGKIDPTRVGLQGWSGGGGNAYSCMVKLPDTFNMIASFFGIASHKSWQEMLDKQNPRYPGPAHRLGARPDAAPDRYLAREAPLGAHNNPYSRIFLFNDEQEPTCRPVMCRAYKKAADAAGLTNVTLTISKPGDRTRYRHGSSWGNLAAANTMILEPLKAGRFGPVEIQDTATLTVLGFVVTRKFAIYCGSGEDAVADVAYRIEGDRLRFAAKARSAEADRPLTIRPPVDRWSTIVSATVDGQPVAVTRQGAFHQVVAPSLNATVEIVTAE